MAWISEKPRLKSGRIMQGNSIGMKRDRQKKGGLRRPFGRWDQGG
jgi:hypothetical protein